MSESDCEGLLYCVLRGLHVHGQDDAVLGPLLSLLFHVYVLMVNSVCLCVCEIVALFSDVDRIRSLD